jgi:hypothetical protein
MIARFIFYIMVYNILETITCSQEMAAGIMSSSSADLFHPDPSELIFSSNTYRMYAQKKKFSTV